MDKEIVEKIRQLPVIDFLRQQEIPAKIKMSFWQWVEGMYLFTDWGQIIPLWVIAIALLVIAIKF